ncbi:MAG: hypothetical protein CMP66_07020 [Flavobacteriales bacterium]|nr:hypothetical protein [Flavobacteriales bacterium]
MKKILFFLITPLFVFPQETSINHWDQEQYISFLQSGELDFIEKDTLDESILRYASFSGNGQCFDLYHKQKLNNFFEILMTTQKLSQEGVFNQSEAKMYDVDWGLYFKNKSSTYKFSSIFNYKKVEKEESGGLISYETNLYNDPLLYPVYLMTAQSFFKNRKFKINHSYDINQKWKFYHSWQRNISYRLFNDDELNFNFYEQFFIDSTQTNDSLYKAYSKHSLGLKHNSFSINYVALKENHGTSYIDINRFFYGIQLLFDNQNINFKLDYLQDNQHHFYLKYEGTRIEASLESKNISPSLFQLNYHSNHFSWNHDWNHVMEQKLKTIYNPKGLEFFLNIVRYQNYLYLDQSISWQQANETIYLFKTTTAKKWNWKSLYVYHQLCYNWTSNESIIRIPSYHFKSDVYLKSSLFHDAMVARLGISIDYFKEHYALAYSPVLAEMYLQNNQMIGNYPFATVFLETKIQSATIRLQLRNVSDIFLDNAHYILPAYPYNPMAVEFGVKWKLK